MMKKITLKIACLLIALALLVCAGLSWLYLPALDSGDKLLRLVVVVVSGSLSIVAFAVAVWRHFREEKSAEHEQVILFKQDVKIINSSFKSAVKKLKKHKGSKLRSLYELPWYVLIGSEDDAKSSLLHQNNLEPVNYRDRDKSETSQYMRFWSNEKMVVIEVDHRLFDRDGIDDALWRVFAQQLMKYRPRQAINGVLAAISCERLLTGDKKERSSLSSNLQDAILTLGEHCGLALPVYTLFTKSDTIADFVEFFSSNSGCDIDQPLGITFPNSDEHRFDASVFKQDSQQLIDVLAQQQFQALRETRQEDAHSVVALPYQLRLFFEQASEFLEGMSRENRVRDIVWLRGMYLCSTEQGGNSHDLLTQLVASNSAFNANSAQVQPSGRKQLFSAHILEHSVLPESSIVGVNQLRHYSYLASRSLIMLSFIGVIIALGLLLRDNWNKDEDYRNHAVTQLALYQHNMERLRNKNVGFEDIIPVLDELRMVVEEGRKPTPLYQRISINQPKTTAQIYASYEEQLQTFLLPQLAGVLSSELYVYVNLGNSSKIFEVLRYYQMLFDKQRLDTTELLAYLVETLNEQGDISLDNIETLTLLMEDLFNSDYEQVLVPNDDLISLAKQNLEGLSPERLIYTRIKSLPEYRNRVDTRRQLGDKFDVLFQFKPGFNGYLLPELFTRQGQTNIDLSAKSSLLRKQLNEFKSIQGDMSGGSISELADLSKKVQRLYYADYVYQWKELINNIEVKQFDSIDDLAYAVKTARSPANSPIIDVLDALVVNTTLAKQAEDAPDAKVVGQLGLKKATSVLKKVERVNRLAGDKLLRLQPSYVVNEAFNPYSTFMVGKGKTTPVDELMAELDQLNAYFDTALSSGDPSRALYQYAQAHATGSQDVLVNFRRQSSRSPNQVANWIKSLYSQSWKGVINGSAEHVNKQWKEQVHGFYRQAVEGRFPFLLTGRGEVAIDDFALMFKPEGRIDKFVSEVLHPFTYWDNGTLKLAEFDGEKLPINTKSLQQIKQAKTIRELFFGASGQELAMTLKLKASSMSTSVTQFNIMETENIFSYRHGPRLWQSIAWPSIGEDDYMSVNFFSGENRVASKSYSGQWALFRALFDGRSSATGDRRIKKLTYKLNNEDIVLQYSLKGSNQIFDKYLFTRFSLPVRL